MLDVADPRYVSELLSGTTLDPGSPAFGGNFWASPYANIRNANTLLTAVDSVADMSDAEKEAIRGFAKTMQALDFLVLINTRDTNGIPLDVNRAVDAPLAPIESKEAALRFIAGLLDEAQGHLQAAGTGNFPFPLGSGFRDFDAPDAPLTVRNFLRFNRGLKARVDVYRQDWGTALTDLTGSFLAPDGSLTLGVYHSFGTGSGDTGNDLNDPDIFVHPSVGQGAETQVDGSPDARLQRKVKATKERSYQGVTSDRAFSLYPAATSPIPILRNEELILLRAEARLQTGDLAGATDDLNIIRVRSGNLAPKAPFADKDSAVEELLTQRRYSLLFEGGHRWIDMRRYGRLGQLPKDLPTHVIHERFPIPVGESDARP